MSHHLVSLILNLCCRPKENLEERLKKSSFPLPELQFLNLADNKVRRTIWCPPPLQNELTRLCFHQIAEEEALMAAALFPMLRELDIHSNPLTTLRSGNPSLLLQETLFLKITSAMPMLLCLWLDTGDPPLLTYYLHERLGITIKRKKAQKKVLKLPLKLCDDPSWKVGVLLRRLVVTLQILGYY